MCKWKWIRIPLYVYQRSSAIVSVNLTFYWTKYKVRDVSIAYTELNHCQLSREYKGCTHAAEKWVNLVPLLVGLYDHMWKHVIDSLFGHMSSVGLRIYIHRWVIMSYWLGDEYSIGPHFYHILYQHHSHKPNHSLAVQARDKQFLNCAKISFSHSVIDGPATFPGGSCRPDWVWSTHWIRFITLQMSTTTCSWF